MPRPPMDAGSAADPHDTTARHPGPAPDRSVYLDAARRLVPRWIECLGPAPWFDVLERGLTLPSPTALDRQAAALVSLGMVYRLDRRRPDRDYLRELIRASLIAWQQSLDTAGRPRRGLRYSSLPILAAGHVGRLLGEVHDFRAETLLRDWDRHVHWLAARPPQTPPVEAALIGTLAEGATIVRDTRLLDLARRRLDQLLASQTGEGWFGPPDKTVDVFGNSLVIDWLARVQAHFDWAGLDEPIARAARFLAATIAPDGFIGGPLATATSGLISPAGAEMTAAACPDSAALAAAGRRRLARVAQGHLHLDVATAALIGPGVTLAAAEAADPLPPPASDNHPATFFNLPESGLAVITGDDYHAVLAARDGGALRAVWFSADGDRAIVEPAVVVVHAHGVRVGDRSTMCHEDDTYFCEGDVHRLLRTPRRTLTVRLIRLAGRCNPLRPLLRRRRARQRRHASLKERLPHERFARAIRFGSDSIEIRDTVTGPLPCEAVILRAPMLSGRAAPTDHPEACPDTSPIYVSGGRRVEARRLYRAGQLVEGPRARGDRLA